MVEQRLPAAIEQALAKAAAMAGGIMCGIGHAFPSLHRPSGAEARQSAFPLQRCIDADTERSPLGEVFSPV
jgi:hypothetical protein